MTDWGERADALQRTLTEQFWLPRRGLYRLRSGQSLRPFGSWSYWWQAHALGAVLDARDRTGDPRWAVRAARVLRGILCRGHGTPVNGFYDDMGWLALELLRMQPATRGRLDRLVTEIRGGASDLCGGGVAWARRHPDFVNVPATGTAALLALRWGRLRPDPELVAWGRELVGWLHRTLVEPDGVVWDGVHARADGTCEVERAEYTYTYGLVVAADVALWDGDGDAAHLRRATRTATTAVTRSSDPDTGLWRSEGAGDGGLFRGILARALGELAVAGHDAGLAEVVARQGEAVWESSDGGGLVGADWTRPAPGAVDLSEHLSGVLIVEQCARLQRTTLLA